MDGELQALLEDMRRLLQHYGPFHKYCQDYAKEHWDLPGFSWPAGWMFVKSFFGLL